MVDHSLLDKARGLANRATINMAAMAKLPKLPKKSGRSLSRGTLDGIFVYQRNRLHLIDADFSDGVRHVKFRFDKNFDLVNKNASKRRVFTFDAKHKGFLDSVNKTLNGPDDHPILSTLIGFVPVGRIAGTVYALTNLAISLSKSSYALRVREGDQIWQCEVVCRDGASLVHIEYLVLVDPFRANASHVESEWILHEERRRITL